MHATTGGDETEIDVHTTPRQLIAARILAGLSQEELAASADVALSALQRAEQGIARTRGLTKKLLAKALAKAGVGFLPPTAERGEGVYRIRPMDAAGPENPNG